MDISPKRNRSGKQFGFARFIDVEDSRLLDVKLDNILINNVKIHANVPKFIRTENVVSEGVSGG